MRVSWWLQADRKELGGDRRFKAFNAQQSSDKSRLGDWAVRFVEQVLQHLLADFRCRLFKLLLEGRRRGAGVGMVGKWERSGILEARLHTNPGWLRGRCVCLNRIKSHAKILTGFNVSSVLPGSNPCAFPNHDLPSSHTCSFLGRNNVRSTASAI